MSVKEKPVSLLDWAYEQIKNQLISGNLMPGQKLVVGALSEQLSISPTPVKEALNRLVADGFLEALPRRGFRVRRYKADEVKNIFECRIMMENYAAPYAVANLSSHPDIASEILHTMEALEQTEAPEQMHIPNYVHVTQLEQSFHSGFIKLAENEHLLLLYNKLYDIGFSSSVYLASYHTDKARNEHRQMYDALLNGDADKLISVQKEHLGRTIELYASMFSDDAMKAL